MVPMFFNLFRKKRLKVVSILLAKNWEHVTLFEYEHLPNRGNLIYLADHNLYYRVVDVIEYVFEGRLIRRFLTVELVESGMVEPKK
jgi:hypothetical protein